MMNARDLQTIANKTIEEQKEATRKFVAKKYEQYIRECEEQARAGKFEHTIDTNDMLADEIAILEKTFLANGFTFKRLDVYGDYILVTWLDAKSI